MGKTPQQKIAHVLRECSNEKGVKSASGWDTIDTIPKHFHFRDYGLSQAGILRLGTIIQEIAHAPNQRVESISFSYNSLNDDTLVGLSKMLPNALTELGLVGCNLTDQGGKALFQWLKNNPSISLLCIEQNSFSSQLKNEFRELLKQRHNLFLMI